MLILRIFLIIVFAIAAIVYSVFVIKGIKSKLEHTANGYRKDLTKNIIMLIIVAIVLVERISSL